MAEMNVPGMDVFSICFNFGTTGLDYKTAPDLNAQYWQQWLAISITLKGTTKKTMMNYMIW